MCGQSETAASEGDCEKVCKINNDMLIHLHEYASIKSCYDSLEENLHFIVSITYMFDRLFIYIMD